MESSKKNRLESLAAKLEGQAKKGHHIFKSKNLATLGIAAAVCLVMANPGNEPEPLTPPADNVELVDVNGRKIIATVIRLAADKQSIVIRRTGAKESTIPMSKLNEATVKKLTAANGDSKNTAQPAVEANPLQSPLFELHFGKPKATFAPEETTWDEAFLNPAHWNKLPAGAWHVESKTDTVTKHAADEIREFLGGPARLVRVRMDTTNSIRSIEIVWLDRGLSQQSSQLGNTADMNSKERRAERGRREKIKEDNLKFAREFQTTSTRAMEYLKTQLTEKFGNPIPNQVGTHKDVAVDVLDFKTPHGTTIRLYTHKAVDRDGKPNTGFDMLMATIHKTDELASQSRSTPNSKDPASRTDAAQKNVSQLPNGDTLINNLPMHDQGPRGGCAAASFAMLLEYWGTSGPWEILSLRDKEFNATPKAMAPFHGAAEDAGLSYNQTAVNMKTIMNEIAAGRPVQVSRKMRSERTTTHFKWRDEAAADPNFKIPKESYKERKDNWPNEGDGGHVSIITGFNKKNKEILLTESWGENYRNARISWDELEATASHLQTLTPHDPEKKPR